MKREELLEGYYFYGNAVVSYTVFLISIRLAKQHSKFQSTMKLVVYF